MTASSASSRPPTRCPTTYPDLLDRVAAAGVTVDPTLGNDSSRFPPVSAMPPHILEMLERLGITDRDEHFATMSANSHRLREHGVRVVSGLATATSVAADDCRVEAGRLAPRRLADLLVVDGDLAADVEALSAHHHLVATGGRLAAQRAPREGVVVRRVGEHVAPRALGGPEHVLR